MPTASELLDLWLAQRLSADAADWLRKICELGAAGNSPRFHLGFSQAPRRLGTAPLALTETERTAATAARDGWQPGVWSVDQAGRARALLALGALPDDGYFATLDRLFDDADLGELVALYRSLAILPYPERLTARAAEGLRSNMKTVYEAVALENPYPADFLNEAAFNQLVLKCLFVGSKLDLVWGVDRRINPSLAAMLCDYARERWAAGRTVSPELWRCVGPIADGVALAVLERAFETGSELDQLGVVLACSKNPQARAVLERRPDLARKAESGELGWRMLAQQYES